MTRVIPFFPNRCNEVLQGLNWFLFGRRVYDKKDKLYYIEVGKHAQLVEEKTGETYQPIEQIKLVEGLDFNKSIEKGYDGIVKLRLDQPRCDPLSLCRQIEFIVSPDRIELIKDYNRCRIVREAKVRNSYLRNLYPEFPSCQEIDGIGCTEQCGKTILNHAR